MRAKKTLLQARPEEESQRGQSSECEGNLLDGFGDRAWVRVGRLAVNGFVDFLTMNRNLFRRDNAQADLIATDFNNGDRNVIVYDNTLVLLSR